MHSASWALSFSQVGRSRGSYLADEKQFEMREREFRREMDAIRSSSHREVVIEVSPGSGPCSYGNPWVRAL